MSRTRTTNGARVLVTDGSPTGQSRSTLAAVRALRAGGYEVAVTVSGPDSIAAASGDCVAGFWVPPADHPHFAEAVDVVAEEFGAAMVVPSSDAALLARRDPGCWLVDKQRLAEAADAAGVARQSARFYPSGAALLEDRDALRPPCVVKVARKDHVGGPDATLILGDQTLAEWWDVPDPVVVEPFSDEPITAVFGVVWHGELVALGAQRYVRTWPRVCGVSSAAVTIPAPDDVLAGRLQGLLAGYDGIFQAQFVGRHLMDVNPRVYGSLPLAVAAGTNLASLWCDLRLGVDVVTPVRARSGVHYRWIEGDVRAIAAEVRDERSLLPLAGLRPRPGTSHSVWAAHDPRPVIHRVGHATRSGRAATADQSGPPDVVAVPEELGLTAREAALATRWVQQDGRPPMPPADVAARRLEAWHVAERVADHLGGTVRPGVLPASWSTDLDVHVPGSRLPGPGRTPAGDAGVAERVLPLDRLHARLGSRSSNQWLVHCCGVGQGRLDVQSGPIPDPLERVLARWANGQPMGLREVVELRRLRAQGRCLPDVPAVRRAARIEGDLGGAMLQTRNGERGYVGSALRRHLKRPKVRRRVVVVAFSGMDGSGKSSQVRALRSSLEAAGVPVHVVWTRPGMQLTWLRPLRRSIKRIIGQDVEPGLRSIGRGDARLLRTRRGLLGRAWVSVLVLAFVWSARLPTGSRGGVVVYDRHVLDALATVRAVYGDAEMAWHRWVLRRLLPGADHTFLLGVASDVAASRKSDEVFTEHLLQRQEAVYEHGRASVPGLVQVDGTRPPEEIAHEVLRRVLQIDEGEPGMAGDRAAPTPER